MPCCLLVVVGLFPRVALVLMWLTGYAQAAFTTLLFPILGFLLMPYTTCAYAIGMVETEGFRGWTLILLIIAIALDLGHLGGSGAYQRRRTVVVERY